jgi:uncharacterized protein
MSGVAFVDNVEFARSGGRLEGRMTIGELPRAATILDSAALAFRLEGFRGRRGEPMLRLHLDGELGLRCQRCLEAMTLPISQQSVYELRASEADIVGEDLSDDEKDFLVFDAEMSIVALVEDELLLSLPVAPKHDECRVGVTVAQVEDAARPFAGLAALKR